MSLAVKILSDRILSFLLVVLFEQKEAAEASSSLLIHHPKDHYAR